MFHGHLNYCNISTINICRRYCLSKTTYGLFVFTLFVLKSFYLWIWPWISSSVKLFMRMHLQSLKREWALWWETPELKSVPWLWAILDSLSLGTDMQPSGNLAKCLIIGRHFLKSQLHKIPWIASFQWWQGERQQKHINHHIIMPHYSIHDMACSQIHMAHGCSDFHA